MSWNYRVVRVEYINQGTVEPEYSIRRCYYNNETDTLPSKWAAQGASPEGDNFDELRDDLTRMKEAFSQPVLTEKRGKLVEWKPK